MLTIILIKKKVKCIDETNKDTVETNMIPYREGEVLVKFQKDATNLEKISLINSIDNSITIENIRNVEDDYLLVNIPSDFTVEEAIKKYENYHGLY